MRKFTPVFICSLLLLLVILFPQTSFASVLTKSLETGPNTVTYRDISNLEPTPTPIVTLDKTVYRVGDPVKITVDDFNGNVDLDEIDFVSALLGSDRITLLETDVNSHVFVGNFKATNSPIRYIPEPPEVPRATVSIDVNAPGDLVLSDFIITQDEADSLFFRPVTHGFDVKFDKDLEQTDGTNLVVTMSYANGIFQDDVEALGTQMYYRNLDKGIDWTAITFNFDCESGSINCDELTVTSDPETVGVFEQITEGQFVLGVDTGGFGGGGGGLVRPGLVFNLLAGISSLGNGIDVSPPSLHFGTPTNTEVDSSGIVITDENKNSFPLIINGNGYYLPEFSTTIDPVKVNTGQDVNMTLTFLESTGVQDVALHFVDENNSEMSESDPIITFYKGSVTKSDPDGILSDDITFSNSKDGNKYSYNFGFSFDQPGIRHLMITAWDDNKNSGNTKVFNAFSVSGNPVPDDGTGHMIYLDLGAYYITPDVILKAGEKTATLQPVIEYEYPDSVGRAERHDGLSDQIEFEKNRANQVVSDKYDLDTTTFAGDQTKPIDSRRAPELTLSYVGHKIRDFTLSPEENKALIQKLALQEELKAQKILDLMYPKLHRSD